MFKSESIDLLNLEWPGNERDSHMVAPIISALERLGYKCITGDIFNYLKFIVSYRPKVLLISSFAGAKSNHDLCSLASSLGIKVISLISEGNVRESSVEEMTWGNNKAHKEYFCKYLLWSERSKKIITRNFPSIEPKLVVTGHAGMDRYKLFDFKSKKSFIKSYFPNTSLSTPVIGLAGWGFDMFSNTVLYKKNAISLNSDFGLKQISRFRDDFEKLSSIYQNIIASNPNTIFILRRHPGIVHKEFCEFEKLKNYPNVFFSQPRVDSHSISDLISISDIWGGYETTTALEAWLLNKNTFLVNPSGSDFIRDELHSGSMIMTTYSEFNNLIKNGLSFDESKLSAVLSNREKLIADTIGFCDGKNHIRAKQEILLIIDECLHHPSYSSFRIILNNSTLFIKQSLLKFSLVTKMLNRRAVDNNQVKNLILKYKSVLDGK